MAYDGSLKFDTKIDSKGFETGSAKLKTMAGNLLTDIGKTVATATAVVGTGITAGVGAAVKAGSDFDAVMSKVSAIGGVTGDSLDSLRDKAKEMGAKTKFSATESAEAFKYMAQAGWDTQQMLSGIDGIMNLSAADGLDLATTSDIVTDALTGFGMSAKDSAHFADVLAVASSSSNTNVSMLGESLKYVSPLAGAMGYSAEDVSVALGLMANASVKGGQAGTSLRAALANLADPTDEMATAMIKLGLATAQTETTMDRLSIDKATNKVKTAQDKYNEAVKKYGKNSKQAEKALLNLRTAEEKLTKAQKGKTETTGFSITALQNADGTNKSLRETLVQLRKAFSGLDDVQKTQYASTIFGKEAMSGMLAILNASDEDFEKLTGNIDSADGAAKRMAETMNDNLKGDITILKSSLEGLGVAIEESLDGNLREAVKTGTDCVNRIKNAFTSGGLDGAIEEAGKIIGELSTKAAGYAPQMVKASISFIKAFVKGIVDNRAELWKAAKEIVTVVGDGLLDLLPKSIQKPIKQIIKSLNGMFKGVWSVLKTAYQRIKKALNSDGFKRGMTRITELLKKLMKAAEQTARLGIGVLSGAVEYLAEHLDTLIPLAESAVSGLLAFKTVKSVSGVLSTIQTGLNGLSGATGGLGGTLGKLSTKLGGLSAVVGPAGWIVTGLAVATPLVIEIGKAMYNNATHAEELRESEKDLKEAMDKNKESAKNLGENINNVSGYMDNFKNGVNNAKSALDDLDDSQIFDSKKNDELKTKLDTLQNDFTKIVGTYSDKRKKLTKSEIGELKNLLKQMEDVNKEQLELQKGYQNAAKARTEDWVKDFDGSANDFAEQSKSYIKAANDSRDKVKKLADEQYNIKLANISKMQGIDEKERKRLRAEAKKNYEDAVKEAEAERTATVTLIQNKYNDLSTVEEDFLLKKQEFDKKDAELKQKAAKRMQKNTDDFKKGLKDQYDWQVEDNAAKEEYYQAQSKLIDEFTKDFDENKQKQLGTWLAMVEQTQASGGEISDETALMCVSVLNTLKSMDKDTQEHASGTIDRLNEIVGKLPNDLKNKANQSAKAFSSTLSSSGNVNDVQNSMKRLLALNTMTDMAKTAGQFLGTSFVDGYKSSIDQSKVAVSQAAGNFVSAAIKAAQTTQNSHSPSKVTQKLGQYFGDGYIMGIEQRQSESQKAAIKMAEGTIKGISDRMNRSTLLEKMKLGMANSGYVQRMKNAVLAQTTAVPRAVAVGGAVSGESGGVVKASGTINAHISIDGREFAVATVPYIDEELAFHQ